MMGLQKNFLIKTDRLKNYLLSVLFFLMCAIPANLQFLKTFLLVSLVILISLTSTKYLIEKKVLFLGILWFLFSAPSCLLGLYNGNPGAIGELRVNFILFYLLFFIVVSYRSSVVDFVFKAIYFASWFITLYTLYIFFFGLGWFNFFDSLLIIDDTTAIGFHQGYSHITNTNLSMTIFIFPFLLFSTKYVKEHRLVNINLYILQLFLCFIAMFISGRRILWIVELISILFFIYKNINILKIKFLLSAFLFFLFFSFSYSFQFDDIIERFTSVFVGLFSDTETSDNIRLLQAKILLDNFWNHPIFGAGAGSTISGFYRSAISPWSFEMSFHKILNNAGVFGAIFYFLFFFFLAFYVRKVQDELSFPVFLGLFFAFLATATNPYIGSSFDFWFFVFFPLMYLQVRSKANV